MYGQVIFDFDYTLVDSSPGIIKCFRLLFENHSIDGITDEQIKRTIGKTIEDSFTELTGITDMSQLKALRSEYRGYGEKLMDANTTLFPDALVFLERLRAWEIPFGIVSLKYRYRIGSFFNDYHPDLYPDAIIGGEDMTFPKPDPSGLLEAMQMLGDKKYNTLYIGDNVIDAQTAQNAGIDFVGITHGTTTSEELLKYPNVVVVSSFEDLTNLFDSRH